MMSGHPKKVIIVPVQACMSLTISHNIMNNINLYHVMADIRMLVDAIHLAVERLGFTEIKDLQLEVVLAIATGQDVFGVLPTGYGKSLCYAFLYCLINCTIHHTGVDSKTCTTHFTANRPSTISTGKPPSDSSSCANIRHKHTTLDEYVQLRLRLSSGKLVRSYPQDIGIGTA